MPPDRRAWSHRAGRAIGKYARKNAVPIAAAVRQQIKKSSAKPSIQTGGDKERAVTSKFDTTVVYKRKRSSKRGAKKRKKQAQWEAKVLKVIEKNERSSHTKLIQYWTAPGTANGQQSWASVMVGGFSGLVGIDDDIKNIFLEYSSVGATSDDVTNVGKMHFKSCVMDCTLVNNGSFPAVFEIYTIKPRRDIENASFFNSAGNELNVETSYAILPPNSVAAGTTSAASFTKVGYSLFEVPAFVNKWLILEKREMLLHPGEVGTWQMRKKFSGKTYTIDKLSLEKDNYLYKKGWSQGYLIVSHGIGNGNGVGVPTNAATLWPAVPWTISSVKEYKYIYERSTAGAIQQDFASAVLVP